MNKNLKNEAFNDIYFLKTFKIRIFLNKNKNNNYYKLLYDILFFK